MTPPVTFNTQAILLLTAPLLAGRGQREADLLTPGEYNRLARVLREKQKTPADLLGPDAGRLLEICGQPFGRQRLEMLLGRGFQLSQALERWGARAIWVVSRADERYPKRLKSRLKEDAPPLLYGCGELNLLEKGGLAVVGSREVDNSLIDFTEKVGQLAADGNQMIVSGGAKGIDRAAMHGALRAGGAVAAVMADSLERAALARDNREALIEGHLLLISPYDPAAGFNVGHAMQRNKAIYAIADAALVVTSDFEKGGTWAGAIEQLERFRFVPVFVRNGTGVGRGNSALIQRGALPWPNPQNGGELAAVLASVLKAVASEPKQESLSFAFREQPVSLPEPTASSEPPAQAEVAAPDRLSPAGEIFNAVREVLKRELAESRTEAEISALLEITRSQAKEWLERLLKEGAVEKVKKSKPARYRTSVAEHLLL